MKVSDGKSPNIEGSHRTRVGARAFLAHAVG